MAARMTFTAWRRGAKNALMAGCGVLAAWLMASSIAALVTGRPLATSWSIGFLVLWASIFLMFIVVWLRGLVLSGRVVMDCGSHPGRWLFVLNAVLFLMVGITGGGYSIFSGMPSAKLIASTLFGTTVGIYWTIMATGRLQIRENGIWQYCSLLPWSKVVSYSWSADSTLLIESSSWLPVLNRGALPVPPEARAEFDEALRNGLTTQPRPA